MVPPAEADTVIGVGGAAVGVGGDVVDLGHSGGDCAGGDCAAGDCAAGDCAGAVAELDRAAALCQVRAQVLLPHARGDRGGVPTMVGACPPGTRWMMRSSSSPVSPQPFFAESCPMPSSDRDRSATSPATATRNASTCRPGTSTAVVTCNRPSSSKQRTTEHRSDSPSPAAKACSSGTARAAADGPGAAFAARCSRRLVTSRD